MVGQANLERGDTMPENIQIKILSSSNVDELENKINEFVSNPKHAILNIQYSSAFNGKRMSQSCMIIYQIKTEPQVPFDFDEFIKNNPFN